MEHSDRTTLDLQSKLIAVSTKENGTLPTQTSKALLILGVRYILGITLLWLLKL